jgi:hypothetical protein
MSKKIEYGGNEKRWTRDKDIAVLKMRITLFYS